ncbi:hypothetical protein [Agromyces ramosus]|uniref:Secreted protein n=1 Tax=Agromyces ramosus TaxID=33879 RepID=A0ABU0R715_9MICO|nr:hypothetical protein [Agromyces ramosus]MDQ0893858.1 hypothetical protein [Agromyces ramosus]
MNRRTAPTVAIVATLAVLMSGSAGAAAQGGQVHDDLSPVAGASLGLARGHVIVRDDLSPTRLTGSIEQAVQPGAARAWSAQARREFHGAPAVQRRASTPWTAEARREFHGADAQQQSPTPTPWTAEARREFHSEPSVTVDDDQSPLNGTD